MSVGMGDEVSVGEGISIGVSVDVGVSVGDGEAVGVREGGMNVVGVTVGVKVTVGVRLGTAVRVSAGIAVAETGMDVGGRDPAGLFGPLRGDDTKVASRQQAIRCLCSTADEPRSLHSGISNSIEYNFPIMRRLTRDSVQLAS